MRRPLAILALLAAAGCAAAPPGGGLWRTKTPVNVAYRCQDGQTPVVRYFPDGHATIRLDDEHAIDLAGQGDAFAGAGVSLASSPGHGARLEVDGKATACEEVDTD